jgi:hypothetical protein
MQACPSHASHIPRRAPHWLGARSYPAPTCPRAHWRCSGTRPKRGSDGRAWLGEAQSLFREMRTIWLMRKLKAFTPRKRHVSWPTVAPARTLNPTDQLTKSPGLLFWKNGRRARGHKFFQAMFYMTPFSCIFFGVLVAYCYHIVRWPASLMHVYRVQGSESCRPARQNHGVQHPSNLRNPKKSCRVTEVDGRAFGLAGLAVIGQATWLAPTAGRRAMGTSGMAVRRSRDDLTVSNAQGTGAGRR